MAEQRQQNLSLPLRVRFRASAEQAQLEQTTIPSTPPTGTALQATQATQAIFPPDGELLLRTRQVKELIRLGTILRAELGLNEVLQQIVASISTCTGFRIAVINLVENEHLFIAAFVGVSEEGKHILTEGRMTMEHMLRLMRPEFRVSQSYFISHEHAAAFADIPRGVDRTADNYEPDGWHPEDALIVPLFSPHQQKLLGFLSLDDPENGMVPNVENIEMIELFANQAAIAIDNARIFQEREAERVALEEAIGLLRRDLAQVQRGNLRVRVQSSHEKLQSVVEAINIMIEEISEVVRSAQLVTQAVDEYARDVQRSSEVLVHDTSQQERQVQHISQAIESIASSMRQVSERADQVSHIASEAKEVTGSGQNKVDRATDGMRQVRETTMQSARIMKRLGESGQEINDTVLAITDLTTRMNLLALNAAIEAVRAGEHGQGFVVIAQEMRTLAVHSAEAARKVANRIRTIQHETSTVSQSVEQNIQHVVMQTELVTETGLALDAISIVTQQMAELVQGIYIAAQNQAHSSQLVVHTVAEISHMTTEITQHMLQMQQSMAHLVELTDSLRSRMAVFRIAER